MADPKLICGWRALSNAVSNKEWDDAERLALELARELELLRDKPAVDRDGLYVIGWQHYEAAPVPAKHALERFNTALRRMPIAKRR